MIDNSVQMNGTSRTRVAVDYPAALVGAPSFRQVSDLIDLLYAAALRPDGWQPFLTSAAAMFGGRHAFISQIKDERQPLNYVGLARTGRSSHPVSRFEDVIEDDPRQHIFTAVTGVTHCRLRLSDEQVRTSRAYREYLQPLDFEYTLHANLPAPDNFSQAFGICRGRDGQPFGTADCDLMYVLLPHLARAFEIQNAVAGNRKWLPGQPAAVAPHLELIRLFGMPPAQARLTVLLLEGRTITEAASMLRLTVGSARQYLRGIFQATGVRRQADLIRVASDALRR